MENSRQRFEIEKPELLRDGYYKREENHEIDDTICANTLIDPPVVDSKVSEDEERAFKGLDDEPSCSEDVFGSSVDSMDRRRVIPFPVGVTQYSSMAFLEHGQNEDYTHDTFGIPVHSSTDGILVSSSAAFDDRDNELRPGMVFRDKRELQLFVKNYFVRVAKEFRVTKSKTKIWYIKCKNDECNWEARASFKSSSRQWVVREVSIEHACLPRSDSLYHCNIDMNMVAQMLIGLVRRDPVRKISDVMQTVKDKYRFEITYSKAWQSLRRAIEIVYGTWESSVKKLPRYMSAIKKYVPGTIVEGLHLEQDQLPAPRQYTLRYMFWAFKPCISGYRHYQCVISLDGTHLYGRYKHVLLIAATSDANSHVFPLAFAIVDVENIHSWTWFLTLVARHVVKDREHTCIISEKHAGIKSAVETITAFHSPQGRHRWCLRHFCSNFNKKFQDILLKDLVWRAGSIVDRVECEDILNHINMLNPKAYDWLKKKDKEKWMLAYDEGWRHGILTTNLLECINDILKGARRLPPCVLVQLTYDRIVTYFVDRWKKSREASQEKSTWATSIQSKYVKCVEKASAYTAQIINNRLLEAIVIKANGLGTRTHVVSISRGFCSCGKWELTGVPWPHVVAVCRAKSKKAEDLVRWYHRIGHWINTYKTEFSAVPDEAYWDLAPFNLVHDPLCLKKPKKKKGCDQITCIRNEMDEPQIRAREKAYGRAWDGASSSGVA